MKITIKIYNPDTQEIDIIAWQRECNTFEINDCSNLIIDDKHVGHIHSDYGGIFIHKDFIENYQSNSGDPYHYFNGGLIIT